MVFDSKEFLELTAKHHGWEIHGDLHTPKENALPRLGMLARIVYKDDSEFHVLFEDKNYSNARSYVESAWAREGILRLKTNLGEDDWNGGTSLPTRDIKFINWMWVFGRVRLD